MARTRDLPGAGTVPGSAWHPRQYPQHADTRLTQTCHAAPTWHDTVQKLSTPQPHTASSPMLGGGVPYTAPTPLQMSPPGTTPSSPMLLKSILQAPTLTFTLLHIFGAVPRVPSHSRTHLSHPSSSPQHVGLQSIGLLRSCAPHTHLSHHFPTYGTPGTGLCPSLDVAAGGLALQSQPGKTGAAPATPGAKRCGGDKAWLPLK